MENSYTIWKWSAVVKVLTRGSKQGMQTKRAIKRYNHEGQLRPGESFKE